MRILLRVIAFVVVLAVVVTALMIVQLAVIGSLMTVARSGALVALTIAGWLAILTCGPVAAVQLWRFRRMGLTLSMMLCAIAVAYLLIGFLFLRAGEAPLLPIVEGILVNGLLIGSFCLPRLVGRVSNEPGGLTPIRHLRTRPSRHEPGLAITGIFGELRRGSRAWLVARQRSGPGCHTGGIGADRRELR